MWYRGQTFNNAIAVFAVIIILVTAAVTLPERNPELTLITTRITAAQNPTGISGLHVSYSFDGQPIVDAWLLNVRVENTGRAPIIGRGEKSSFLSPVVPLKMLGVEKIVSVAI